ncbi:hypothetical protein VPH35_062840 [Triticum aestivum]
MDGDRPTPAAAAASVRSVLGDDDLFREILLRLGFPNCLVRASLVSKRWLFHVSDPAFLCLFRERNPPRLLGFCVSNRSPQCPWYEFVQLPQSPELAALVRRGASSCNDAFRRSCQCQGIQHVRNGRLIAWFSNDGRLKHSILAPLLAGESEVVLPPTPPISPPHREEPALGVFSRIILPEDGSRGFITLVYLWQVRRNVRAEVYVLRSGGWGFPATAMTGGPECCSLPYKNATTRPWQGFHGDQLWVHPGSRFGRGKVPQARAPSSNRAQLHALICRGFRDISCQCRWVSAQCVAPSDDEQQRWCGRLAAGGLILCPRGIQFCWSQLGLDSTRWRFSWCCCSWGQCRVCILGLCEIWCCPLCSSEEQGG